MFLPNSQPYIQSGRLRYPQWPFFLEEGLRRIEETQNSKKAYPSSPASPAYQAQYQPKESNLEQALRDLVTLKNKDDRQVNIYETANGDRVFEIALPGISKERVSISVTDLALSIIVAPLVATMPGANAPAEQGTHNKPNEHKIIQQNFNFDAGLQKQISFGNFKIESVTAAMCDGLLTVKLQKQQRKSISVEIS